MGIANSKQIKNVVPLGDNDYYLVDPDTGKNLLRPQWKDNYNQNSTWHADAIEFLHKKGPGFHPALTKAILASKTDDELSKRNEAIYKNFAKAYSKSGEDPETKEAMRVSKCMGRRKHRKIRVSESSRRGRSVHSQTNLESTRSSRCARRIYDEGSYLGRAICGDISVYR